MLAILQNQSLPTKEQREADKAAWRLHNLLLNPIVMKAALSGNTGKAERTVADVMFLHKKLGNNEIFKRLLTHCETLNDKNLSMLVRSLKGEWKGFWSRNDEWHQDVTAYAAKYGNSGKPNPPKAKALKRVTQTALKLERSKFTIKSVAVKGKKRHDYFCVTLFKKQIMIPCKHKGMITEVGIKHISSASLCYQNGEIKIAFNYTDSEQKPNKSKEAVITKTTKRRTKIAGADVGLNRLLAIFIDDKTSQSLLIDGYRHKSRNVKFNRFNAKLDESIAKEVTEWRTVKQENKESEKTEIKEYPIAYNNRGLRLKRLKSYLIQRRNNYFDAEFQKISRHVTQYLLDKKVTNLVLSRNLSFAKTEGSIKLRKKTKQQFYQIPFGTLLNLLKTKCESVGITVDFIDEAWSSKTSCISADVNKFIKKAKADRSSICLTTDLKGSRVKRGVYVDKIINKAFNSDLNGAVNHIKIAFPKKRFKWLETKMFKLCNPLLVQSSNDFYTKSILDSKPLKA